MDKTSSAAIMPLRTLTSLAVAGALALGGAAFISLAAQAQDSGMPGEISTVSDDLGTYLVDGNGATLYYFVPDAPGLSVCEGGCLEAWPPVTAAAGETPAGDASVTGTLSFAERDDGISHASYRGRPLYYFKGDEAAGDTNGQGANDVWWVAAEDGSLVNAAPPESPELTL